MINDDEWLQADEVDGNKYLDFTGANQTVILGHSYYVMEDAPNLPGKSYLEDRVSAILGKYTNTQYFRYFKNGSDAVSCALRLARHCLTKPKEAFSIGFLGYGGCGTEYSMVTNGNGVPITDDLIRKIIPTEEGYKPDNDSYDILVYESRYASVANVINAKIKICDHLKSGILGLDESTADFDLYGKSLGNGYPIAVMTGKDEYMEKINDIFYSTTFGGDNVGLRAILETHQQFKKEKKSYLLKLEYAQFHLKKWKSVSPEKIKRYWKEKGILFNGYWQLMVPHTLEDIARLKEAIEEIGY